jgi:His-Xaa-Ser system radical SAM maturase HxsB
MNNKEPYVILPMRFMRMPHEDVLLVNEVGEYLFVKAQDFENLIGYSLDISSETFLNLKGKHMITDTNLEPVIDMLATKYRTKKGFLLKFTTLHMIVVTLRCNHKCLYCHASSEDAAANKWDMTTDTARKVVEIIFQTPSPEVKIEFQGGEPLLNWKAVTTIVESAEKANRRVKKNLSFVLCTNLTLMDREKIQYIKDHDILISTSLDGPKDLHDSKRVLRNGNSSYDLFTEKLELSRSVISKDRISALMTISRDSLDRVEDIIDEYIRLGFKTIFLRALNPFGYAKSHKDDLGYDINRFLDAYKRAINYMIELNIKGVHCREAYTALLLSRILTPFPTGFMDLQSPAGAGICGAIYDFNGDVYPCDEARMLAKMGNKHFLMGNVHNNKYLEMFDGRILHELTANSCVETLPGCAWCAFQPYCGADPVRNFSEQGNIIGHRPTSEFCKKNMGMLQYLLGLLKENNDNINDVFWSWITRHPLERAEHVESNRETC